MVWVHQVHPLERREQPGDAQIEGAARAVQIDRVEQAIARRRRVGRIPGIAGCLDCAVFHTDRISGGGLRAMLGLGFSRNFLRVRACVGFTAWSGRDMRMRQGALRGPPPSDRLRSIAPRR